MPKKVIYTKEEILKKAYEMFKIEGLNQLTARTLAKKLSTSPAPIYGYFNSMDELKEELVRRAKEQFLNFVRKKYTQKPFLNAGMGFVIFAREENKLFKTIFLSDNKTRDIAFEFKKLIFEEVEKDSRFVGIDIEKKEWLYDKCWTYTYGLATLNSIDNNKKNTDEDIEKKLLDLMVFFEQAFEEKK